MRPRRVPGDAEPAIAGPVTLKCDGWVLPDVGVARTRAARRRGLRPRTAGRALILRGASVHSFGMAEPLSAIGIGADGRVVARRTLRPGRIAWLKGAMWVVELPVDGVSPPIGSTIRVVASS